MSVKLPDGTVISGASQYRNVVLRTGSVMTGPLTLSGDPTENLHPVTKQYLEKIIGNIDVNGNINLTVINGGNATSVDNTKIILRNDTNENWESVKDDEITVLDKGEIGLEYRTEDDNAIIKIKIGDGIHTWGDLPYYEETFEEDFIFTSQFGKYIPDDTGSVSVPAKGKTMAQLLKDAYSTEDTDFDVTEPYITLSAGNSQGYKSYEVGTEVTPKYSIIFNPGSYPYGPETGVTVDEYSVTFNGETLTGSSGTFKSTIVTDGFNEKVTAFAKYNDANASPNSNLGNPVDSKKILAGNTPSKTGSALTGYRSIFYGYTTKDLDELTSDDIRGLTNGGAYSSAKNFEIKANGATDAKYFIIAIPSDNTRSGINKVDSTAGMVVNVTDQWIKNGKTIQVADARGGENGLKDYNISYWTSATIDSGTIHKIYLA